ncbi:glycosyl hydrolase family 5, partial [bacterium]|nr:glycosyl hydrolase family 5 [bacterium]
KDFGVHIFVGEFSAIRWAPGDSALNYLRDCIDLFEEHGWDWTYHAFREWTGWSVEYGSDMNDNKPSLTQTPREKLLRSWFSQNLKPEH